MLSAIERSLSIILMMTCLSKSRAAFGGSAAIPTTDEESFEKMFSCSVCDILVIPWRLCIGD